MRKKLLSGLLCLCLLISLVPSNAYADNPPVYHDDSTNYSAEPLAWGYCGASENLRNVQWFLYLTEDSSKALTFMGTGQIFEYTDYNYPWSQFKEDVDIVYITGITNIPVGMFAGFVNLSRVEIWSSPITTIGKDAFWGCTSLTCFNVPDYVTSIGDWAFSSCTSLTSVEIPSGVTSIGDCTFSNCTSLTSVTIPSSVTSIGYRAFHGCEALTDLTIGSGGASVGVTEIGNYAFYECGNLQSLTIGSNVGSIGEGAFGNCSNLISVSIPPSVTSIGNGAFRGCDGLTDLTIGLGGTGDGVTEIGNGVFAGCRHLQNLTIGSNVGSIGDEAFVDCTSLVSVTIPSSVRSIGYCAFNKCESLTYLKIDSGVSSIGSYAFGNCKNLFSVTIPGSLTSTDEGAFHDCENLEYLVVQPDVTTLGRSMFNSCYSLTTIYLPVSLTEIEEATFWACRSLSDVYYAGSEEQWNAITIGSSNQDLLYATIHFGVDEDDSEALEGEATLYREQNSPDTLISTLSYAAGSFAYEKSTPVDITNWETTNYDIPFYAAITLTKPEEWKDYLTVTPRIKVTLPDGLSFSENSVERERTFQHTLSADQEQFWIPDPVYLLYSEKYTTNQELKLQYELSFGSSGESIKYSAKLADLEILSTVRSIQMLRDGGTIERYTSWNPSMFVANSAAYHSDLALLSAYLSDMMEGSEKDTLRMRINSVLTQLGFSKIQYSGTISDAGYEEESVCAVKKVVVGGEVKTIVLYAIQGSDFPTTLYGLKDWLGNFTYSGLNNYHENFRTAATRNLSTFNSYCGEVNVNKYEQSTRVLITGHSRGGAIANLIAARLMDGYNMSNLYCYTFAAPNVEGISVGASELADGMDEYYNIFNIINCEDIVPFAPGDPMEKHGHKLVFNSHYSTAMGTYYNNPAEGAIVPLRLLSGISARNTSTYAYIAQILAAIYTNMNGIDGILANHDMNTYIRAVKSNSFDSSYSSFIKYINSRANAISYVGQIVDLVPTKTIGKGLSWLTGKAVSIAGKLKSFIIRCPVDVEILDASGTVICRIANDKLEFCNADDISILIYGDEKEITYPYDADYTIRVIGYDAGTMDFTAITTDENGDGESVYRFYDVPVSKNDVTLTSHINASADEFISGTGDEMAPDESETGGQIARVSVVLDSDQGDVFISGSEDYIKGDYVLAAITPLNDGLNFEGWYDERGLLFSVDEWFGFSAEQDTHLTAKFEDENAGNIKYTFYDGNVQTFIYEANSVGAALPSDTRADYTFDGWTINGEIYKTLTAELMDSIKGSTSVEPIQAAPHFTKTSSGSDENTETYAVAVTNGSGSGSFAEGASVTITANSPENGKRFKEWTGADGLAFTSGNKTTATATFTMPADAVSVTAIYEDVPATTYAVTVTNGSGSGSFAEGASVTITADTPENGKRFKEWAGADNLTFTNGSKTTAAATFEMPAGAVNVTAVYDDVPTTTYSISVTNGSGSGSFAEGASVTITANTPESGKRFKEWTGADDLIFTNGDRATATATFTMPAKAVSVTAIYEDVPVSAFTITFDANGGDVTPNSASTDASGKLSVLPTPTRSGSYSFNGWYTAASGGTKITTETAFSKNTTIYAQWNYTGGNGGGNGGGGAGGNGGGGGIGGGNNGGSNNPPDTPNTPEAETTTNEDGSITSTTTAADGTVTETTKNTDGSIEVVETKPDGTVTKSESAADGTTGTTVTDTNGSTISAKASVSEDAIIAAVKADKIVSLPIIVSASESAENAPSISVALPGTMAEDARIEVPVTNVNPGVVAYVRNEAGALELIKDCYVSESGVVLTLDGSAELVVTDNSKTFSDVSETSWEADAVRFVTAREIFNGVGTNRFNPAGGMSRGMIAQVLFNFDRSSEEGAPDAFAGETMGAWYNDAANWCAATGIMVGTGSGFGGEQDVTREQLATILYRYANKRGYDTSASGDLSAFVDGGQTSGWAKDAMSWAVGVGLIGGTDVGLEPRGNATRAQVAMIMMRFCKIIK